MFRHIVCFKLKKECLNRVDEIKAKLLSMKEHIELLKEVDVGLDVLHSERSFDIYLNTLFDSIEDMNAYQVSPYHAGEVLPLMREVAEQTIAIDFEF